jgi:D-arginine utilization repressor
MASVAKYVPKVPKTSKAPEVSEPHDPFRPHFAVGEAIATLLHPYAEVVLHDLRTGRIVRIWNSFTERQAGDLSNLKNAADMFPKDQQILGPYEKALLSQGRTKSITASLRDNDGDLIGFLCINLDVSIIDRRVSVLSAFASPELKRPEPIYRTDLAQHINYLVRDYSLRVNKPIDNLARDERMELVALVDQDGLFQARNSVMLVAKAMKISRASVYNLLAESNKSAATGDPEPTEQPEAGRRQRGTGGSRADQSRPASDTSGVRGGKRRVSPYRA